MSPELNLSDEAQFLWDTFFQIDDGINRRGDGTFLKMAWGDIAGWLTLTGNHLEPTEIAILKAMDVVYTDLVNEEIAAANERRTKAQGKPQ